MEDYQIRVIDEWKELGERIDRLTKFMYSPKFLKVKKDEQVRLRLQMNVMLNYSEILSDRIKNFK